MTLPQTFFEAIIGDLIPLFSLIHGRDVKRELTLDLHYILDRIRCEGNSFLSSQLSHLGKAVELSAITGSYLSVPHGMSYHKESRLPKLFHTIFCIGWTSDGKPRFTEDYLRFRSELAFSLQALRQLTLAFSKVTDVKCLVTNEESVNGFISRITNPRPITCHTRVLSRARQLLKSVLCEADELHPELAQWDAIPFGRHGPGAVANREKGARKWYFQCVPGITHQLYNW